MQSYEHEGTWYKSDGTPYADQLLARGQQFRDLVDDLMAQPDAPAEVAAESAAPQSSAEAVQAEIIFRA